MSAEKKPISLAEKRRKKKAAKDCPICGRPPGTATAPFCSKRCADADLAKWLGGEYKVPTAEKPDEDKNHGDDE